MATENTSLKNTTPSGRSNTTDEMIIGKSNTYQRTFLIVAGSLLALLVWIVNAGTTGGQHLQSSADKIAEGAVALADYQVDSTNLALTKDIFGLDTVSENDEACSPCDHCVGTCRVKNKGGAITTQSCSNWDKGYCVCKGCCDLCTPASHCHPGDCSGCKYDCNGHCCDNVFCTVYNKCHSF